MTKDHALQLLLIVDYVFDWARDNYRNSVLRQLKCLATQRAYAQVKITYDIDIASLSSGSRVPSQTLADMGLGPDEDLQPPSESFMDHQSRLPFPVLDSEVGSLRSSCLVSSQVVGLYITKHNAYNLYRIAKEGAIKSLLEFLAQEQELLELTGHDLDDLEEAWTGKLRQKEFSNSFQATKFYVLIEIATFISSSWNQTRELTYIAMTEEALDILVECENYSGQNPARSLPKIARSCSFGNLNPFLKRIRSVSAGEMFLQATACTLI